VDAGMEIGVAEVSRMWRTGAESLMKKTGAKWRELFVATVIADLIVA
jgi:hypothetical protein